MSKRKFNLTNLFKDATYAASGVVADSLNTEEIIAARLWLMWRYQLEYKGQLEGSLIKKDGKIVFKGSSISVDGHMTEQDNELGVMPERFIEFISKVKSFLETATPAFKKDGLREFRFNPDVTPEEYIYIDLDNDRNILNIRVSHCADKENGYQERLGEHEWERMRFIPLQTVPPCRDEIQINLGIIK